MTFLLEKLGVFEKGLGYTSVTDQPGYVGYVDSGNLRDDKGTAVVVSSAGPPSGTLTSVRFFNWD